MIYITYIGVQTVVKQSMEESLQKILTPKTSTDILRFPFFIYFNLYSIKKKSINLFKKLNLIKIKSTKIEIFK